MGPSTCQEYEYTVPDPHFIYRPLLVISCKSFHMGSWVNDTNHDGPHSLGKSILLQSPLHGLLDQLTVLVIRPIRIGHERSQSVIVRVTESNDMVKRVATFFAKFFDSSYYTPDTGEFVGSAEEFVKWQLTNELESYERMEKLQGISVPRCFGQYVYPKEGGECVNMILLEYISFPLLQTAHGLAANEWEGLETQCTDILKQIHSCVHNDITGHNIFWSGEENRVIICDFATALIFDNAVDDEEQNRVVVACKARDTTYMSFTLKEMEEFQNRVSEKQRSEGISQYSL